MNKKQINDMLRSERYSTIKNYVETVQKRISNAKYLSYIDKLCFTCILIDCEKEILNDE